MRDRIGGRGCAQAEGKARLAAGDEHFEAGRVGCQVTKGWRYIDRPVVEMESVKELALLVQDLQEAVLCAKDVFEFAVAIQIDHCSRRQAAPLHVNLPNNPPALVEAMDHSHLRNQADVRAAIEVQVADRNRRSRRPASCTPPQDVTFVVETKELAIARSRRDPPAPIGTSEDDRRRRGPRRRGPANVSLP